GETFVKICARAGLHAYAYNSYQSVIRGGHVLFQVEVGSEKKFVVPDFPDLLIALNQDTIDREAKDAAAGVLYNRDRFKLDPAALAPGSRDFGLPVMTLCSNPLMQNTVALGASLRLANLEFDLLAQLLRETFRKKSKEIQEANVAAARAGYDYALKNFPELDIRLPVGGSRKMVMSGNQAFGLGAVAAGCKFYSAYPMTPASSIMHWLAPHASKYGIVFKQAEDELAAMNMAVGAGHAGVRAMTGTSGGGFALMTEAVGLAAMIEAPVVVVEVQRGGPSTGLPTKTEQGDLFQVLGAGQGDFPKVVLAPATVEEAFYLTAKAFNIAEKFQVPVFLMSDLLLSEHNETVDSLDLNVPIERGVWAVPPANGDGVFLRYKDTETGVSPRAVPGQERMMFVAGSDEHDERGDLVSDIHTDPVVRTRMMNKRMRKLEYIAREMPTTEIEGPAQADLTLVGWGSTYGMMRRIMEYFNQGGRSRVNLLAVRSLWPFPWKDVSNILYSARKVMALEVNYSGQLCRLIRQETGFYIHHRWFKYDGEPFYPGSTFDAVEEVLRHG
ncbi:MAG: 2-oxoacid:acceptor oxidoreductase subunit alpha, partial [Elusimicrobia bacterium]|nr:2-oxoacid:acceptor oxidoreductase subunit alpha [Elusimicrobiota bacterium]